MSFDPYYDPKVDGAPLEHARRFGRLLDEQTGRIQTAEDFRDLVTLLARYVLINGSTSKSAKRIARSLLDVRR